MLVVVVAADIQELGLALLAAQVAAVAVAITVRVLLARLILAAAVVVHLPPQIIHLLAVLGAPAL
jgi:hypothetical protein